MLSDQEVERVSSLSTEALLAELGLAVVRHNEGGLQARPPSVAKVIGDARKWLEAEHDKLRTAICNDPKVRAAATTEPSAREKVVRVVADAISGVFIFVPAGTLAEILVRDGIPKYCEAIWRVKA